MSPVGPSSCVFPVMCAEPDEPERARPRALRAFRLGSNRPYLVLPADDARPAGDGDSDGDNNDDGNDDGDGDRVHDRDDSQAPTSD